MFVILPFSQKCLASGNLSALKTFSINIGYAINKSIGMNNFFRTIFAGWGAWKLGGGCVSTIVIFVVLYYLLGHC